jgi:lipoprotein-anchoring transpeptidase ErfK/SrfK
VIDVAGASSKPGANIQQYESNNTDAQKWQITQNEDETYTLVCAANGLAMDVSGANAANKSNIQCYIANGTAAQKFVFAPKTDLLSEGTFAITSALSSSKVIEVAGANKSNGANVSIYSSNETQAQKWSVAKVSGSTNTYTVRSVVSGKYLAMESDGNVCVKDASTDGSQYWLASIANGKYTLTNVLYNKVLDVSGASTANGTNVQGYASNATAAQQFSFTETCILKDGMYLIRNAQDSNQVLDVANASSANCANIQTYTYNKTAAQKWNITYNWDGTYTIANIKSNKSLDVANGNSASGANVQQYDKNSSKAQKWKIVDNANGTFSLVPALNTNLAVTVAGNIANGTNVNVQTYTASTAQSFTFEATSHSFLSAQQQTMLNKANTYASSTNYLILVDCSANKVGIYYGSKGNWSYTKFYKCTSGAASTPTKKGVFTVASRGLSFGSGYTCWYWTQFSGNYLFHSVLYNSGSKTSIQDGRLGINASHGCVRLALADAKWIYDNIPSGTKVVVY